MSSAVKLLTTWRRASMKFSSLSGIRRKDRQKTIMCQCSVGRKVLGFLVSSFAYIDEQWMMAELRHARSLAWSCTRERVL